MPRRCHTRQWWTPPSSSLRPAATAPGAAAAVGADGVNAASLIAPIGSDVSRDWSRTGPALYPIRGGSRNRVRTARTRALARDMHPRMSPTRPAREDLPEVVQDLLRK